VSALLARLWTCYLDWRLRDIDRALAVATTPYRRGLLLRQRAVVVRARRRA